MPPNTQKLSKWKNGAGQYVPESEVNEFLGKNAKRRPDGSIGIDWQGMNNRQNSGQAQLDMFKNLERLNVNPNGIPPQLPFVAQPPTVTPGYGGNAEIGMEELMRQMQRKAAQTNSNRRNSMFDELN